MSIRLLGTGRALPSTILTNEDLSRMVDTSDEWIFTHTGIRERRVLPVEETIYPLALEASQKALEDAGIRPEDLTMIIASTVIGADVVPNLASQVMGGLDIQCPAFDINAACSGFVYAINIASAMAKGPVLIVCAEQTTRFVDYTDRSTNILFGDGAGAAVVEPGEGLLHSSISGSPDRVGLKLGPHNNKTPQGEYAPAYLYMDGQEVYKFATREMMRLIRLGLADSGLAAEDIAYYIPHQANVRIIQSCAQRIGMPMERFYVNIDRYGNTSSASVPIALDELRRDGKLKVGDAVLLAAFGGGWSSGCAVWRL